MRKKFFSIFVIVLSLSFSTILNINATQEQLVNSDDIYFEEAESDALGVAGNFNLFVLEDLMMSNTDTEGRMAVGGDIDISKFGIGDKVSSSSSRFDLIAGSNVKISETENKSGNTLIDNTSDYNVSAYGHLNNVDNPFRMNTKGFFEIVKNELYALSNKFNNYDKNGTSTIEYNALKLIGNHVEYNVFEVDANDLKNAIEVKIEVPFNSTVIVNVIGDDVSFPMGHVFYNGLSGEHSLPYASTILWNMPETKK